MNLTYTLIPFFYTPLRESFEAKNISLEELEKLWKEVAPINNLDNLKGKEIHIYLSKSDTIVPYINGKKLVIAMKEKGLSPKVYENEYLGHYGTISKFYFFPQNIDSI